MPLADGKERIYVTVSCDMASRIDFYRNKMGLSRSAYCSYLIGQGVMSMDKAMGIVDQMGSILTTKAVEEVTKDENQIELTACEDCANDCKDEVEPGELAICEKSAARAERERADPRGKRQRARFGAALY